MKWNVTRVLAYNRFEQYAGAIFQLSPLEDTYKYELSREAIECCEAAIEIIRRIYNKAESTIRNREFFFHINRNYH